ncbi:hypothetical protein LCGC14_2779880, partial [marine sediment metagenome]
QEYATWGMFPIAETTTLPYSIYR